MKTLEELLNYNFECLDKRDINRVAQFLTEEQLKEKFNIELKEEYKGKHVLVKFNRENVLKQLKEDVEFGWEKACDERGISSSLMFSCVRMWNWVLEEGLENWPEDDYAPYGKPLFEATAEKYGFELY